MTLKQFTPFEIKGEDSKIIKAYKLEPKKAIATFHIIHGLSEYGERYLDFANFLYKNNIAVYTLDNRGFGKTSESVDKIGIVNNGDIKQIVNDHIILTKQTRKDNIPSVVLGHSFGSFVLQKYIQEYHDDQLIILSGSNCKVSIMFIAK
jgi:alpha-beta hydrolase superfamily lysophospholipase